VAVLTVLALVAAGAVVGVRWLTTAGPAAGPPCQAAAGSASFRLDLEQAANATTVAAVGKRLGLPNHAVTVALAAALQESKLRNVDHGDLDSLGIFQQRPSQGWGTASQVMVPRLAAAAFYGRLANVPGWQAMTVTDAAQAVQHSAAPDAYARWETEARLLAQVTTGEVPAGLTCRIARSAGTRPSSALPGAMAQELGSPALGVSVPQARGWTVAAWLVGHARQYRISSVAFYGRRWTPALRTWRADGAAGASVVQVG
jgi:hypothetical protein